MAHDPVCGMEVSEKTSIKVIVNETTNYFCSHHCKDKFIEEHAIKEAKVCLPEKKPFFKNRIFAVSLIPLLLIALSFFIPQLAAFRNAFLLYLKTIWWAVLLGLCLGGAIDYYVPREYISKILSRKKPATILNAVGLGFLMSACSHGILALSIQLHKKGASNPAVISFLLASPWANLTITVMLIGLFGVKGIFIILAALLVAVNTGFIFMFLEKKNLIEKNKNIVEVAAQFSIIKDIRLRAKNYKWNAQSLRDDLSGIGKGAFALAEMVLWWIILGMFIASLAGAYIPVHIFHKFMGPTILGLIVTLILATIIEVCSEGSSPLAFEIFRQTGALGNSFVFLMAGVATDYTEIGLIWTNIGKKTAIWLVLIAVPQIVFLGYLFNLFF